MWPHKYEACLVRTFGYDEYEQIGECSRNDLVNTHKTYIYLVTSSILVHLSILVNMNSLMKRCYCYNQGNRLMKYIRKRSEAQRFSYVPWVVVNGVHNEKAELDLLAVVCAKLSTPKPTACFSSPVNN